MKTCLCRYCSYEVSFRVTTVCSFISCYTISRSITCGQILNNSGACGMEHNVCSIIDVVKVVPGIKSSVAMDILQL